MCQHQSVSVLCAIFYVAIFLHTMRDHQCKNWEIPEIGGAVGKEIVGGGQGAKTGRAWTPLSYPPIWDLSGPFVGDNYGGAYGCVRMGLQQCL